MKTPTIIICLFCTVLLNGQNSGLHVEYDLFTDQISYTRNDVQIEKPYVKKGENIYVTVKEINQYIYKTSIEVEQLDYNQGSGFDSSGELSGGSGGFSFGNLIGGLGLGGGLLEGFGSIPGSRGALNKENLKAQQQFKQKLSTLKDVENEINKSFEKLLLFQKAEAARQLAVNDIDRLKNNKKIKPSRIKEMIEEEIRHAFAKSPGEKIDIDDIIDKSKEGERIELTLKEYYNSIEEYKKLGKDWRSFTAVLAGLNFGEDQKMNYIENASDSILHELNRNLLKFDQNKLEEIQQIDLQPDIELLSQLRQVYEELQSQNFSHSFTPIQPTGDEVVVHLSFDEKTDNDGYMPYKSLTQNIPVTGAWKIKGGAGISFGVLNNRPQSFEINDASRIVANDDDQFVPYISSFIHCYKTNISNVAFGGSFGAGIPIQGGTDLTSLSFFLGPSLLVGSGKKVSFTAGLMGAKAQRLSGGLEAGDIFDGPIETLSTTKKYELGFFLGFSIGVF